MFPTDLSPKKHSYTDLPSWNHTYRFAITESFLQIHILPFTSWFSVAAHWCAHVYTCIHMYLPPSFQHCWCQCRGTTRKSWAPSWFWSVRTCMDVWMYVWCRNASGQLVAYVCELPAQISAWKHLCVCIQICFQWASHKHRFTKSRVHALKLHIRTQKHTYAQQSPNPHCHTNTIRLVIYIYIYIYI